MIAPETVMGPNGVPIVETPERRRIREFLAVQDGAEVLGFATDYCPEPSCWQLMDARLERQQERQSNYDPVRRCATCGNTPISLSQRKRLIEAAERASRERLAGQVRTLMAQYRSGSWHCQHNRRWFLSPPQQNGSGGRPVHSPTRPPFSQSDYYVCDCGWDDSACWSEHKARQYKDVIGDGTGSRL